MLKCNLDPIELNILTTQRSCNMNVSWSASSLPYNKLINHSRSLKGLLAWSAIQHRLLDIIAWCENRRYLFRNLHKVIRYNDFKYLRSNIYKRRPFKWTRDRAQSNWSFVLSIPRQAECMMKTLDRQLYRIKGWHSIPQSLCPFMCPLSGFKVCNIFELKHHHKSWCIGMKRDWLMEKGYQGNVPNAGLGLPGSSIQPISTWIWILYHTQIWARISLV